MTSRELDRYYIDSHGVRVHVIRWDVESNQVIFLRDGYEHGECMRSVENFKENFKRVEV
ncbi:TPA: DUF4222 domain-containing protein [Serratia marcescens]|uniref:DUF4222 domain-containing protein n=1 Tax=Serratia bockelmannii TaxID=2703793 RepID=UPI0038C5C894